MEENDNQKSPTVFSCIYDTVGKVILLVHNTDKPNGKPGKWGLPGGGVEKKDQAVDENGSDKTLTNAAYRELEEETSLFRELIEFQFHLSKEAILVENKEDRENPEDFHQDIIFFALTKIPASQLQVEPAQRSDVDDAKWVSTPELYQLRTEDKIYRSHFQRITYFLRTLGYLK